MISRCKLHHCRIIHHNLLGCAEAKTNLRNRIRLPVISHPLFLSITQIIYPQLTVKSLLIFPMLPLRLPVVPRRRDSYPMIPNSILAPCPLKEHWIFFWLLYPQGHCEFGPIIGLHLSDRHRKGLYQSL